MITDIITDALLAVGFDPAYILFGTEREVNQLLDKLPLRAVDIDNPNGIDMIAAVDLVFTVNSKLTQYGNALDTMQMRILFARKNPGSVDCFQTERFNRAMGMLTYAKRFALALNNDPRTRLASGYLEAITCEATYHLFDCDMDGVVLTVPITSNAPVVPVC